MKEYVVHVKNESESKEAQELFKSLGYSRPSWASEKYYTKFVCTNVEGEVLCSNIKDECEQEVTLQQLNDLVVLNKNSVDDAQLKLILKTNEKKEMKEYLEKQEDGTYLLWKAKPDANYTAGWIEIPEGCNIITRENRKGNITYFHWKHLDSDEFFLKDEKIWGNNFNETLSDYIEKNEGDVVIIWSRQNLEEPLKDNRVEYFEKFLNGEKIQYRIGSAVGSPESQWHNLTWNSLKDMKHTLIEFREAPKYVTINGIEFKTTESLLKHVKNNYNLGD